MSKILDKKLLKELELLGLTEKESIVYIDLLQRATPTGTSKIVLATKLHGQYIYNALESLEEKSLVKHSIINGRKKFEANSPTRLKHLIDEKKSISDRVTNELLKLSNKTFEQSFEVYQGESSFINHELEMARSTPEEGFWYVISSRETKFVEIMGDSMQEFIDIAAKKKIKTKAIGIGEDVSWFIKAQEEFPGYEYKMLPGLKKGSASLVIRNGSVSFESFEPKPLCYTIHNELVADNYKNLFEVLWSMIEEKENKKPD